MEVLDILLRNVHCKWAILFISHFVNVCVCVYVRYTFANILVDTDRCFYRCIC